jgi:excisionase family DNA binding protein
MTDIILNAAEVAKHFRISQSTLRRWVFLTQQGKLNFPKPVCPFGYHLKFRRSEIENWMSNAGNEAIAASCEEEGEHDHE